MKWFFFVSLSLDLRLHCSACCNTNFYTRITQRWSVRANRSVALWFLANQWSYYLPSGILLGGYLIYIHLFKFTFTATSSNWCPDLDAGGSGISSARSKVPCHLDTGGDKCTSMINSSWIFFCNRMYTRKKVVKIKSVFNDNSSLTWLAIYPYNDTRVITFAHFYCFPTDSHRRRAGFEVC